MSSIAEAIQDKCMAFGDRVIKLNDYLLKEAANAKPAYKIVRSKSYIALKEARESLYWIELLKRNNYIDERQYQSIYADCEELVKILVSRCKKLDQQINEEK